MSVPVAQNFTCAADISGAGYGTAFEPVQRARFEALHSAFLSMGVSLRLDYVYGPEYAEARFSREALMDGSPGRTVPASHLQTIRAALSQAVRDHELAPVVQAVDFRKRTQLPT